MKSTRRKTAKNPMPGRKAGVFEINTAKKTTAKRTTAKKTMPAIFDGASVTPQLSERLYDEHGVAIGALVSRLGGEQNFNSFVEERTDMALKMLEHNGYDLSSLAGEHRELLLFYIAHRILMETERRYRTKAA